MINLWRACPVVHTERFWLTGYWCAAKVPHEYELTTWSRAFLRSQQILNQEIPRILWNMKVHYRIHNSSLPVYILSQNNPVHASPFHFLNILFNIVLPSTSLSSKWSSSLRSAHQSPVCTSPVPSTCYKSRPSHSSWFDRPNDIWYGLQIIKLLVFSTLRLRPKFLLSTLFSNNLVLSSCLHRASMIIKHFIIQLIHNI